MQEVKIAVGDKIMVDLEELHDFQGDLKNLSTENYERAKASILKHGFSFCPHVWTAKGKHYLLDGHQRKRTLTKMREDGYKVPKIPAIQVQASGIKEAKEKVLAAAAQYGEVTDEGLYHFISENQIAPQELNSLYNFPEVSMPAFMESYYTEPTVADGNDPDAIPTVVEPRTKPGDLYILGDHRLMCGDASLPAHVQELMGGVKPRLMVTDPPYGVEYDATWREKALKGNALGKSRTGKVTGDAQADWYSVWSICEAQIVYVWHASAFSDVVMAGLRKAGFEVRQQIIWNKSVLAMSRSAYHWKHEPCWYAVREGCDANWIGDRKGTTVWDAASPTHIMSGSKEEKTAHPTQKPSVLYEIPIGNHIEKGGWLYDPFAGSGTAVVACEKTGRRAMAMEIDPVYCDIIVARWEQFSGKKARKDGEKPKPSGPVIRRKAKG